VVDVRDLADADRPWLRATVAAVGGSPVVSISGVHDPAALPGFVAEQDGSRVGAVTYRLADGGCEIVTLTAVEPGRGAGTALLAAVRAVAESSGTRLWLLTTDDNAAARRFYERRGLRVVAVHRDFVDTVRATKPGRAFTFRDAIEYAE
jgi:ribosomal protein S18 acetylase RimI-like enzyme